MNATETEPRTRLLSPLEVAEQLGVAPTTLRFWRDRSEGPPAIRIGRKLWKYRQDSLLEWLDRQKKVVGA